jgi:hypothetical protein
VSEILDAVLAIVLEVLEVVLRGGGGRVRQQEPAMKDDLQNCIADLQYAKMRCRQEYGVDLEGCHRPGFTDNTVFYTSVILNGVLNYGARSVEDSFVYDCTAAVFRLVIFWLHRVAMPSIPSLALILGFALLLLPEYIHFQEPSPRFVSGCDTRRIPRLSMGVDCSIPVLLKRGTVSSDVSDRKRRAKVQHKIRLYRRFGIIGKVEA